MNNLFLQNILVLNCFLKLVFQTCSINLYNIHTQKLKQHSCLGEKKQKRESVAILRHLPSTLWENKTTSIKSINSKRDQRDHIFEDLCDIQECIVYNWITVIGTCRNHSSHYWKDWCVILTCIKRFSPIKA